MSDVEVRFAELSRLDLAEGDTLVLRIPAAMDYGEWIEA